MRYFISSLPPQVKKIARAIRGHWGIENGLHWVLDMYFAEDRNRAARATPPPTWPCSAAGSCRCSSATSRSLAVSRRSASKPLGMTAFVKSYSGSLLSFRCVCPVVSIP